MESNKFFFSRLMICFFVLPPGPPTSNQVCGVPFVDAKLRRMSKLHDGKQGLQLAT